MMILRLYAHFGIGRGAMRMIVSRYSRHHLCLLIAISAALLSWRSALADPPAQRLRPQSVEFEGMEDGSPLGFRDLAGLSALLKQVRSFPMAEMERGARRDLGFGELSAGPAAFRGTLVELRGIARRFYPAIELGDRKGLFEVWITVPIEGDTPFACVVETLPSAFPRQQNISQPVVFRGFFFKIVPYPAGNVRRAAALFTGRLEVLPDHRVVGVPPGGQNDRLPSASAIETGKWLKEDEITIELVEPDRLLVDGRPVTRDGLLPKLEALAERTRRNAQVGELAIDSVDGLPAVLTFRASAQMPFAALSRIMTSCRDCRFHRFRLKLAQTKLAERDAAPRIPVIERPNAADLPDTIRRVPILVWSDGKGQIGRAEVGENVLDGFSALERELKSIFSDPDLPFDKAKLEVDRNLRYSEVVRLVDMLGSLNVKNVTLAAADD
jgi:biopolymer transport protein ExbD